MRTAQALCVAGVEWFKALDELSKADPEAAAGIASAMYGHLARYRPESPAPLDAGFAPTEVAADPRGR